MYSVLSSPCFELSPPCYAQGDAFDSTAATGAQTSTPWDWCFKRFPGFYLEMPEGYRLDGYTKTIVEKGAKGLKGNYTGSQTMQVGSAFPLYQRPFSGVWNSSGATVSRPSVNRTIITGTNIAGSLRQATWIPEHDNGHLSEVDCRDGFSAWRDSLSHEDDHSDVFAAAEKRIASLSGSEWAFVDDVFSPSSDDSLLYPGSEDPFAQELTVNQGMGFSWNLWQPAQALAVRPVSDAIETGFESQRETQIAGGNAFVPVLQGATNGTIGPQRAASTLGSRKNYAAKDTFSLSKTRVRVIPEKERLSNYRGKTRVVFIEPGLNLPRLNSALKTIETTPARVMIQAAYAPVFTAKTRLPELLSKLAQFEAGISNRQIAYKITTTLKDDRKNPGKTYAGLKTVIWGEVYNELPASSMLKASICVRASELETDPLRKLVLQGRAACHRGEWNSAWKIFESVFKKCSESPEMVKEIAEIYARTTRDLETCIWLSRYLRIAPDWNSFELAYSQRARIEEKYLAESLKNEEPNISWESKRMPLKVYLGNDPDNTQKFGSIGGMSSGADPSRYDQRLQRIFRFAFNEWRLASGLKISYVETDNASEADISCYWSDCKGRYKQDAFDPSLAPTGKPNGEHLGDTQVLTCAPLNKDLISKAVIMIYSDQSGAQRCLDENLLRAICLHELGHALGIRRHLKDKAVMYPTCDENEPLSFLREKDGTVISDLYKKHPVVADSMESYILLHSTPVVERDEDGEPLMLVRAGESQVPAGLIMDTSESEDSSNTFVPFSGFDLGLNACLSPDFLH